MTLGAITLLTCMGGIYYGFFSLKVLAIILVIVTIPIRLKKVLLSNFFLGRSLLNKGKHESALPYFRSFMLDLSKKPWLKQFKWISINIYTSDIEVKTLNHMAVAQMELGKLDEAHVSLQKAVELDEQSPFPYFNFAILFWIRGNETVARQMTEKSHALGYKAATTDNIELLGTSLLARLSDRGIQVRL